MTMEGTLNILIDAFFERNNEELHREVCKIISIIGMKTNDTVQFVNVGNFFCHDLKMFY